MQPMAKPSHSDIFEDTGRDFPKFGDLLHAASYSPTDQSDTKMWLQHSSSSDTSETDGEPSERESYVEDEEDSKMFKPEYGAKPCSSPGCTNTARSRGLCPSHGGGTRCRVRGCTKHVVSGGLCVAHGGGRRCRAASGCSNSAVGRGLCVQHGGGRKCSQPSCNKHVASGGLCRTHGGGRRCQMPNCTSSAQSRGLCYVHGGGGRCQREGCGSSAKKGGLCIAHGGGHRCQVEGCTSSAVSGARCRAHGGGRRCAIEGCTSSAKTGGRCIAHGGGKRCTVSGCTSSAQRLGLCKAHGGGRRCVVEDCANSAVSRGRCIAHGGGKRCVFEGCTTTARKGGFCFAHGGRSTTPAAATKPKVVSSEESPLTPATIPSKPWPSTKGVSPIPEFMLPPRTYLPSIKSMLMANRPGIIRRSAPIPPIRNSVGTFGRHRREVKRVDNPVPEDRPGSFKRTQNCQVTPTETSPTNRAGYSWQRLQETVRRESVDYGLADDESDYSSNDTRNLEDGKLHDGDVTRCTKGGLYWTRSRGPVPT